jgi:hypothetical protein
MSHFQKRLPVIEFPEFLKKVAEVKNFKSSQGRNYQADEIINDVLHFRRLDAGNSKWDINLKKLYQAYTELEHFQTANFSKYVPRRHSPGRGLLLNLGLINKHNS